MANFGIVKRFISERVFPEMIKEGMYSSFSVTANGKFDFSANAIKELKDGEIVQTWRGYASERIRIVICDRTYLGEMLEFDLDYLISDVFSGTWYNDDSANIILIVRKTGEHLEFSWIRRIDFILRMEKQAMTRKHLQSDFKDSSQIDSTLWSGHQGELFLRDIGKPDRLLLNYDMFFAPSVIRSFQVALKDPRIKDIGLGWVGECRLPGKELLSAQELDKKLNGNFSSTVSAFKSSTRGRFADSIAQNDVAYYSQDVFDRVVGTVACLIENEPQIADNILIARLSRLIAPMPMNNWVNAIAVQYKAMLNDKKREVVLMRECDKTPIVNLPISPLDKMTTEKIDSILNRATHEDDGETRSRIRAIRLYEEAAKLGSTEAFVKLAEIGSDINSLLFGNIDLELDRMAMPEKDRQYIKDRVYKDVEELAEVEVAIMLRIANEYGVLHAAVESMASDIEEATDALDDDWMHSNGHDDGETFD